jgi:hypothetical protein
MFLYFWVQKQWNDSKMKNSGFLMQKFFTLSKNISRILLSLRFSRISQIYVRFEWNNGFESSRGTGFAFV